MTKKHCQNIVPTPLPTPCSPTPRLVGRSIHSFWLKWQKNAGGSAVWSFAKPFQLTLPTLRAHTPILRIGRGHLSVCPRPSTHTVPLQAAGVSPWRARRHAILWRAIYLIDVEMRLQLPALFSVRPIGDRYELTTIGDDAMALPRPRRIILRLDQFEQPAPSKQIKSFERRRLNVRPHHR
jgi:hypothetical protein